MSGHLSVVLDAQFRDDLARALISHRHQEIAEEMARDGFDLVGDSCYGPEKCGGCAACVLTQATYRDWTDEGFAVWTAMADGVLRSLTQTTQFRQSGESGAS